MNTDYMSAVHAEDKEKDMAELTREFLENHFKFHNKLTIYQGQIPLTITKAWHLHLNGGHHDYDIVDCEDLADLCSERELTLKPVHTTKDEATGTEREVGIVSL